jgi:hypothetical protein
MQWDVLLIRLSSSDLLHDYESQVCMKIILVAGLCIIYFELVECFRQSSYTIAENRNRVS